MYRSYRGFSIRVGEPPYVGFQSVQDVELVNKIRRSMLQLSQNDFQIMSGEFLSS